MRNSRNWRRAHGPTSASHIRIVPFQRALTMWFTPRVEMMGYSGNLWPLQKSYEDDPVDFDVTLLFGAIGILYVALALAGAVRIFVWRAGLAGPQIWAVGLLVLFCILRTAFLTRVEAPEPRYVLECFPRCLRWGHFYGVARRT